MLLSASPVIVYNFDEGFGTLVHDTAPDGAAIDGALIDDGGVMPEFHSGDGPTAGGSYLHFGGDWSGWDFSIGGRVETTEPLHPILGGSSTIAFYIRTMQFGAGYPWESPGVTGAEDQGTNNDVFWGNMGPGGEIRVTAGNGPAAASPSQVVGGSWHRVVQSRDAISGTLRTYFDGRLVAAAEGEAGVKQAEFSSIGATTVHFFGSLSAVQRYLYFNGDLDQIEIYDRALDPAEVAALYGVPSGRSPVTPSLRVDTSVIATNRLEWEPVPETVGYIVGRATSVAGPWTEQTVPVNELGYPESFTDTGLTPGTRYFYEVIAFNGRGQSGPAAANAVASATGKGVLAHYWDSGFWGSDVRPGSFDMNWYASQLPDQTVGVGQSVVFDWQGRTPTPPFSGELRSDNFSTAFSGKILAPETGDYMFTTRSDDDGILYVGGQLASLDPFGHGLEDARIVFPITLNAGIEYEFLFLHAEQGGAAALQLNWATPSGMFYGPVPVDYLIADDDPPLAPIGLSVRTEGQTLHFDFTDTADNEWGYVLERRSAGGAFEAVKKGAIAAFDPFNGVNFTPALSDVPVAAGTYEYRVRAYNAEGSAASNTVSVTVGGTVAPQAGAQAFYINDGAWGAGKQPAAGGLPTVGPGADFTQTVGRVDFDFGTEPPLGFGGPISYDFFSTVFTGTLRSAEAGTYQIFLETDDDGYLLVNGQVVSADRGPHLARDPRAVSDGVARVFPITLAADTDYNFVALQADRFNNASVVMKWVRPGQADAEVVPDAQFTSNLPGAAGGTAAGAPVAASGLGVADADLGATFLTLRWNDAATNELRYVVERATTPTFTNATITALPINSTSFTDFDLTPGTRYYYRLSAANYYGQTTTTLEATTLARERLPAAPADLRGAARAAGVNLAFTDLSTTEDEFVIERAPAGSASFAVVGRVPGNRRGVSGGTIRFTDTTAAAATQYAYRVYASNSGGASSASNTLVVRAGSPGGTGADAVYYNDQFFTGTSVTASGVAAGRNFGTGSPAAGIDVNTFSGIVQAELLAEFSEPYTFYTDSDDGIEMSVYDRDTGQLLLTGPHDGVKLVRGMQLTGFQDTIGVLNLTAGRRYLLEWRFTQGDGLAGYRVGWSSPSVQQEVIPTELLFTVNRADVPLFPVGGLGASAFGAESVNVRWDDRNFGETGFRVERKLASDPDSAFVTVGTAAANVSTFSDTSGVAFGVSYVYRVTALRGGEVGPLGGTVAVLPGSTGGFVYSGAAEPLPGPDGSVDEAADNLALLTSPRTGAFEGSAFTGNAVPIVSSGVSSLFGSGRIRGFTVQFDFAYPSGNPTSQEGLAFVIQRNSPDAVGRGGYESGYGGIDHSFAVGFQPAYQTTYPFVNGTIFPAGPQDLPFFFGYIGTRVELEYNATEYKLTERLTQLDEFGQPGATFERTYYGAFGQTENGVEELSPLDIPAMMGGQYGFFGFTASGPHLQETISNFSINGIAVEFLPTGAPPPPPPPGLNATPTANAGGPYTITEGESLTLDASGSSDADGDQLTYVWDINGDGTFGDATGVNPTLAWWQLQALGIDDGPLSFAVSVRVSDGQADPVVAGSTLAVQNGAPTSVFYFADRIAEGTAAPFYFSQATDPSAADTAAGFTYSFAVDRNHDGLFTDDEAVVPIAGDTGVFVTFGDDGVFNVRGRVTDKDGGSTDSFAAISVENVAPIVGAVTAPSGARRVNTDVSVSTTFTDAGSLDTHTAVWDWGDGTTSAGVVTESQGSGSVTGKHRYAAPGLYAVTVTVSDDNGGSYWSSFRYVVVYDPNSAGVSGTGWLDTPAGRAAFTFDVRYKKNATTPTGNVAFGISGMLFRSTSLDWEVVTRGGTTFVRGHGTVNGHAGYSFLLAVVDTGSRRGAPPDRLRMKIWNDATGDVVFDNQLNDLDDAAPLGILGGGNIVLQ